METLDPEHFATMGFEKACADQTYVERSPLEHPFLLADGSINTVGYGYYLRAYRAKARELGMELKPYKGIPAWQREKAAAEAKARQEAVEAA